MGDKMVQKHMLKHVETFHTQILAWLMFCHVPEDDDAHLKTSKRHNVLSSNAMFE